MMLRKTFLMFIFLVNLSLFAELTDLSQLTNPATIVEFEDYWGAIVDGPVRQPFWGNLEGMLSSTQSFKIKIEHAEKCLFFINQRLQNLGTQSADSQRRLLEISQLLQVKLNEFRDCSAPPNSLAVSPERSDNSY